MTAKPPVRQVRLRPLSCLLLAAACCLATGCQNLGPPAAMAEPGQGTPILITFTSGEKHEAALLNSFSNSYHRGNYGPSLSTRRRIDRVVSDYPIREQAGWVIDALGVYCGLFTALADTDVNQLLERLEADERVESSQLLYDYHTRMESEYNDPYFDLQYGHARPFILNLHQWSTGKGINVAVIDSGVDALHPDLRDQIAETRTFLTTDDQPAQPDIHGTAVAGIIAARANNGSGIVGLAPDAQIHVLKACRQVRRGSSLAQCDSFTLARALSFAIDKSIEVINLSLSGPRDPLVSRLIHVALAQGQVVAAADPGEGKHRYPALLDGVIAVREESAAQSSAESEAHELIVYAPRTEILSTGPGGGYDFYSGSSIATAIVSGLTALLLERDAEMSSDTRVAWLNQAMGMEIGPSVTRESQSRSPVAGTAVTMGPTTPATLQHF